MNRVQKIKYKGKEIIHINYVGLFKDDEMIEVMKEAERMILSENKPYLHLSDISNTYATPKFMSAAKKFGKSTKGLASKSAIIGVTGGVKELLLKSYYKAVKNTIMKAFDTEEEAKEYLIK